MEHVSLLATADGRWIPADGAALLQLLGDPEPDFDPVGFVVRNLGFVQYEAFADSFAQITLFPKRVALPALDAVRRRVLSGDVRVFRLDYLDDETKRWTQELAMNPREAVGKLNRLCGTYAEGAALAGYEVEPLDLGAVMADERHPAHALLRKWRSAFHQFDDGVMPFIARNGLASRSMVIGVDPQHPEPVFRFIGEGYAVYGGDYFLRAVGEKVSDQPDKRYGEWVAPFYTEVAATWRPRLDRCSAPIQDATRPHLRYERLILPWSTGSGEVLLTLSTRFLDGEEEDEGSSDKVLARNPAKSS